MSMDKIEVGDNVLVYKYMCCEKLQKDMPPGTVFKVKDIFNLDDSIPFVCAYCSAKLKKGLYATDDTSREDSDYAHFSVLKKLPPLTDEEKVLRESELTV